MFVGRLSLVAVDVGLIAYWFLFWFVLFANSRPFSVRGGVGLLVPVLVEDYCLFLFPAFL
jgi:hypothetical protein